VTGLFRGVLERADFGVLDNFFDLSGHSLLAARFMARLRMHRALTFRYAIYSRALRSLEWPRPSMHCRGRRSRGRRQTAPSGPSGSGPTAQAAARDPVRVLLAKVGRATMAGMASLHTHTGDRWRSTRRNISDRTPARPREGHARSTTGTHPAIQPTFAQVASTASAGAVSIAAPALANTSSRSSPCECKFSCATCALVWPAEGVWVEQSSSDLNSPDRKKQGYGLAAVPCGPINQRTDG